MRRVLSTLTLSLSLSGGSCGSATDVRSESPDASVPSMASRCVAEELEDGVTVSRRSTEELDIAGRLSSVTSEVLAPFEIPTARFTYLYDAEGRPVSATLDQEMIHTERTASYETGRIVVVYGGSQTYEHVLEDGRVVRSEGPMEVEEDHRSIESITYDDAARITCREQRGWDPELGPVSSERTYVYDGHNRVVMLTRVQTYETMRSEDALTYRYEDTSDGYRVVREGARALTQTASFVIDGAGRLLRSGIDEDGDGTEDWFATYRHEDDSVDAMDVRPSVVSPARRWRMRGRCPLRLYDAPVPPVPMPVGEGVIRPPIPGQSVLWE